MAEALPCQTVFAALASKPVIVAMARGHEVETELFGTELIALGDAVPGRAREFSTGRACAREALAGLGVRNAAVAAGPSGEPLWPEGVVGSITHCDGLRACAVAPSSEVRALGIDAEPNVALPTGMLQSVSSAAERVALPFAGADVRWDRLLFSAKEAAFKAWFPMTGQMLGFEDVHAQVDVDGTFCVRAEDMVLHGRWAADATHVACMVVVGA